MNIKQEETSKTKPGTERNISEWGRPKEKGERQKGKIYKEREKQRRGE
jgi:hypothetical protein